MKINLDRVIFSPDQSKQHCKSTRFCLRVNSVDLSLLRNSKYLNVSLPRGSNSRYLKERFISPFYGLRNPNTSKKQCPMLRLQKNLDLVHSWQAKCKLFRDHHADKISDAKIQTPLKELHNTSTFCL